MAAACASVGRARESGNGLAVASMLTYLLPRLRAGIRSVGFRLELNAGGRLPLSEEDEIRMTGA